MTTLPRFLAPLVMVWCAITLHAQPIELGVAGGVGFNTHSASFKQLGTYASCCPEFSGGSGVGVWGGAGLTLPFSPRWRVSASLVYNSQNGSMLYDEVSFVADLRDTPRVRDAVFHHELTSTIQSLGLEPRIAFRPFGALDVAIGFRIAYVVSTHFTQTETLSQPDDYGTYLGTGRTWVNHDAAIPDARTVFAGLIGALRYTVPLNARGTWLVQPELAYVYPMTGVATGTDWSISDLRLGIGLAYAFVPALPPVDTVTTALSPVPPVLEPQIPAPPTAHIMVEAVVDGRHVPFDTVRIEETRIIDFLPVLPHVYFTLGSDQIQERYVLNGRKALPDPEQLQTQPAITAVLGVVANRLGHESKSTVLLTGCISDAESEQGEDLSRRRAEAVRNALIQLGVASDRIRIRTRRLPVTPTRASNPAESSLANEENQRVEVTPSDPTILAPLVLSTTRSVVTPDSLFVTGTATASSGIARRKARPSEPKIGADTVWSFVSTMQSPLKPDSVYLEVTDSLDRTARAMKPLPVSVLSVDRKRTEHRGEAEVERYSLILFGFDDATVTNTHRDVLNRIRQRISEGARIRILGMSDVMGTEAYNMDLSRRRASEVARALGLGDQVIESLGASKPQFDNTMPEGRAYNRTVIIEVRN